jgi:DNA gyrase/topoisomerase IV subunit B
MPGMTLSVMRLMKEWAVAHLFSVIKVLGNECGAVVETTMDPSFRTLRQVTIDSLPEADRVFSMLMGDEVPPRREFIEKNAIYANIDA